MTSGRLAVEGATARRQNDRGYFLFVFGLLSALFIGFIIFSLYLVAGLRSGTYSFFGGAPFSPYMAENLHSGWVLAARWAFFILTEGLILSTTVTVFLEFLRWRASGRPRAIDATGGGRRSVVRFDTHLVIVHFLIMSSVTIVGALGIPQAFPDWGPARWWIDWVYGGLESARVFHHRFGYIVDATMFYYVGYMAYSFLKGRKSFKTMVPSFKDGKDFIQTYLYCFGISKEEPKYDRYSYGQKIDFWTIVTCLPLLSITGLIMFHTAVTSQFIPSTVIAVFSVAHRHIALLLAWFITTVHIYYGHLAPQVFPGNSVIFTGRMSEAKYRELFPGDYERITNSEDAQSHIETRVGR